MSKEPRITIGDLIEHLTMHSFLTMWPYSYSPFYIPIGLVEEITSKFRRFGGLNLVQKCIPSVVYFDPSPYRQNLYICTNFRVELVIIQPGVNGRHSQLSQDQISCALQMSCLIISQSLDFKSICLNFNGKVLNYSILDLFVLGCDAFGVCRCAIASYVAPVDFDGLQCTLNNPYQIRLVSLAYLK